MDYEHLIRVICEDLIDDVDSLIIREMPSDDEKKNRRTYLMMANDSDVARLIGKNGKIIRAIREVVNITAKLNNEFVDIKIENFDK